MKNTGLILEETKEQDYIFGGYSPLAGSYPVVFADGHGWLKYQRPEEKQYNNLFDTYSCVTFGCLKALGYYMKAKFGLDMDFSERFTAVMSGTIPGKGNSVRNVLESIRKHGFVLESDYPSLSDGMTQSEWFAYPPKSVRDKALKNLERWNIHWESLSMVSDVKHEVVVEALRHTPVIITLFAWSSYLGNNQGDEGVYKDYNNQANHCCIDPEHNMDGKFHLEGFDKTGNWDLLADDTYPQDNGDGVIVDSEYLKKLSKDFRIWSAHRIWAEEIETPKTDITLLNKIIMAFKKICRDIHGGLWFKKKLSDEKCVELGVEKGSYGIQKIESLNDLTGALVDEVGCEVNNMTDDFISTLVPYKFFGK